MEISESAEPYLPGSGTEGMDFNAKWRLLTAL